MEKEPNRRGLAPSHPGVHLADVLDGLKAEAGLSRSAVVERLEIGRRSLYDVIEGLRPMSPRLAVRLEALGLSSAEFWMNLQQAWDLAQARRELEEAGPAIDRVWPVGRSQAA